MKQLNYWPVKKDVWKIISFFTFTTIILVVQYHKTNQAKNIYGSLFMGTLAILSFNGFKKRKIIISEDQIEIPISNLIFPRSKRIFKYQQIKSLKEKYIFDQPVLSINSQCNVVSAYLEQGQYDELKKILENKTNIAIQIKPHAKNQKKRFIILMWFLLSIFTCIFYLSKSNNISKTWWILLILLSTVTLSMFIVHKLIPIPPTQRKE